MILDATSQVLSCVKTTALVHDVRRQLSEDGAQVGADFFQENVFIEDGSAQQQLATIKDEESEPAPDQTVAIWITWPTNDTVFTLGDVVLAFETRGFPSGEIPIEVSVCRGQGDEAHEPMCTTCGFDRVYSKLP